VNELDRHRRPDNVIEALRTAETGSQEDERGAQSLAASCLKSCGR